MTTNQSEDEGLRAKVVEMMLYCIDDENVTESNLLHFTNYRDEYNTLMALISQKIIEVRIDERDSAHRMHQREMNQLKKERGIFLKHIETHVCPMVIELPKGATLTQGIKE